MISSAESSASQLPTLWRIPDELWTRLLPLLNELDPPKHRGWKRIDPRAALEAIIFHLRSGCQWNHFPKEFPDDSSVHRTFQRWIRPGVFARIWVAIVEASAELDNLGWEWQAVDAAMGKARCGGDGIGPNPTDRGKKGTKRSLLVEASGGPLAVGVAGANVHDTKLLEATLAAIVVERPDPTDEMPQHVCLDKGYDNPSGWASVEKYRYILHIRRIGEEKFDETREKRYPARRWVENTGMVE